MKGQEMQARIKKALAQMNLFDDALMTKVFDGNLEVVTLLLEIILERKDLKVLTAKTQQEYKSPFPEGRSVRIDVYAEDSAGKVYDIEIQQASEGANPRRARFNSGRIDSKMLMERQDFKELHDSYVIFITRKDVVGDGLPIYHFNRVCEETGKPFGDGSYIIYVNGTYTDPADPIGRLMHDFWCVKSDEIFYPQLARSIRYFKEEKEGSEIMSTVMQEWLLKERQEGRQEGLKEAAGRMIEEGEALEKIAKYLNMSFVEVQKLEEVMKDKMLNEKK